MTHDDNDQERPVHCSRCGALITDDEKGLALGVCEQCRDDMAVEAGDPL